MRAWWLCLGCAACGFHPGAAIAPDGSIRGTPDTRSPDARPPDAPPDAAVPDAMIDASPTTTLGFVQAAYQAGQPGSSVALTLPAAETPGDFNIVGVSWVDTSSTITQVTDTDGNTYTQIGTPLVKNGVAQLAIYAAWNIRVQGATNTLTIMASRIDSNPVAVLAEYRGVATDANPVDVMAGKTGAPPGPPDSGMVTTTNAHDLIVGIGAADTNMSAGTGFTARTSLGLDVLEDQIVNTTGGKHATATQAPMGTVWLMRMVAVKAAD